MNSSKEKWLFWACFIALVATSFGFVVRAQIIGDWQAQFNLSETQKGELLGVGLWPFAISIVLFSLVIDKIGYGRAMIFAFLCHVGSAIITIFATGYWMLYLGTFVLALGNGTVEAVINPVVATMFPREKTKWLNILHAGWPGGMVLGGILALSLGSAHWGWKVGLVLIPAITYGILMFRREFPIHERVKAGISYKAMLQEVGTLGALIVVVLIVREIGRVFEWSLTAEILVAGALVLSYGLYAKSLGRPMFIFLLLIMMPLATTELGTDSWITDLMVPFLAGNAVWVLVYTAFIMMVLRFFAGPIVHRLSPLGLLATSSAVAIIGLIFLSKTTGIAIFLAATVYGFGKTFFWPTMLGVVAERFPRGGAMTLNTISGVGMLSVGIIGAAFLGNIQDKEIDQVLAMKDSALYSKVVMEEKTSVFGNYRPLNQAVVATLSSEEQATISNLGASAKKNALSTVAVFPAIMLVCYLGLIFYFRAKGGYKPVDLEVQSEGGPEVEKATTG
jgi:MFS family permease